jgi:hypothetical protein
MLRMCSPSLSLFVLANFISSSVKEEVVYEEEPVEEEPYMMPMKLFFLYCHVMSFILRTTFTLPAPYNSAVVSVFLLFFYFCGFPRVDAALTTVVDKQTQQI